MDREACLESVKKELPLAVSQYGRLTLKLLAVVFALTLAFLVTVTPLDLHSQIYFGAGIFFFALIVNRNNSRWATLALMSASLIVTTRYLFWRITVTMPTGWSLDTALGFVLLMAEIYAYVMLLLAYFQMARPLERRPTPLPRDPAQWPTVDVYIPTLNERLDVVRPTVLAARDLDWPEDKLNVYLLDDGCRPEFRAFATAAGVHYLERHERTNAKAGNLNNALSQTYGEFIAVFDSDHIPARSFLQMTLGALVRDPKVALVQTPHHFYSPDPFERNYNTFRAHPNEGELFYGLIQPGNDLWNAAFFCGSCAVLRRSALEEVGKFGVESVTEDALTSLRLQRKGYSSAFLKLPQAAGLATDNLAAHIGQRQRWARGMTQIFRKENPLLGRGLSFAQRLCYLASMLHFMSWAARLVFILAPLSYLFLDAQILNALPLLVVAYAAPHLAHLILTNSRLQGGVRYSFWSEVYETCLAPYTALPTLLALVAPSRGGFKVTSKGGKIKHAYFNARLAAPYIALAIALLIGISIGIQRIVQGAPNTDVTLFNLFWALYSLAVVGATICVAREAPQRRISPRLDLKLTAALHLRSGHTLPVTTKNLSVDGAVVRCNRRARLVAGDPIDLCLAYDERYYTVAAEVVDQRNTELRLRFVDHNLDELSRLVGTLFGRADAWSDWYSSRRPDRPLSALASVALHGARGMGYLITAPLLSRLRMRS